MHKHWEGDRESERERNGLTENEKENGDAKKQIDEDEHAPLGQRRRRRHRLLAHMGLAFHEWRPALAECTFSVFLSL